VDCMFVDVFGSEFEIRVILGKIYATRTRFLGIMLGGESCARAEMRARGSNFETGNPKSMSQIRSSKFDERNPTFEARNPKRKDQMASVDSPDEKMCELQMI
jgi:hypothetical protein